MKAKHWSFLIVLIALFALLAACWQAAATDPTISVATEAVVETQDTAPAAVLPAGVAVTPGLGRSFYDQVYCQIEGVDLIFDLHYPTTGEGPYPLVIYVHGGSWQLGDRRGGAGVAFADALLDAGYAFAGVDYRLAPAYPFPAQIEDVKCAVRFLRANADLLELDSNRFAALGGSAGGHLVSLLGLTADQDLWESAGQYEGVSSRVSLVVDMFGAVDLRVLAEPEYQERWAGVFGDAVDEIDSMWEISPLAYVTNEAPPFLILQGNLDDSALYRQSQELAAALEVLDVPVELIIVYGGGHGTELFQEGATPDLDSLTDSLLDFLGAYLN